MVRPERIIKNATKVSLAIRTILGMNMDHEPYMFKERELRKTKCKEFLEHVHSTPPFHAS